MSEICEFFQGIKTDFDILCNGTDTYEDAKTQRMLSIGARTLGTAGLGVSAAILASTVISLLTAPFSGVILLTLTVFMGIFVGVMSHDLIVIGCNQSKELALLHNPSRSDQNILQRGLHFISNARQMGELAAGEIHNGVPYTLQGTWLIGPLVSTCSSQEFGD